MTYILIGVIFTQAIVHYFERKDLYNRLMCKDIHEYKNINTEAKKVLSAHTKTLRNWRSKGGVK